MTNRNGIRSFSGQPSQPQNRTLEIKVGHNGTHVVALFTISVKDLVFTEAQTEAHIAALQEALVKLREHKAEA